MKVLLVVIGLVGAAPVAAETPAFVLTVAQQHDQEEVDHASDLISESKPADAVAALDTLMAAQAKEYAGQHGQIYCARSTAEKQLYQGFGSKSKPVSLVPQSYCYAVFLKGFALIDLNRGDEAKGWLDRAVAMAPSNSHFLGELAEWYKERKDWPHARALFQRALDASALSPDDRQIFDRTRGMRGLAYILIEDGKLDEAEAIYRKCVELDPNDARSKQQLQYIASQRQKG